jgi:hypothetical protein
LPSLSLSKQTALDWIAQLEGIPPHLYEVEGTGDQFTADMSWITAIGEVHTFEGAELCARRYWEGQEHEGQMEVLVQGHLIIGQRVTPIPEDAEF